MPVSKKAKVGQFFPPSLAAAFSANSMQIQREHKKAEAAGTRAAVKPNGLPVKAAKPTAIVSTTLNPDGQTRL